VIGVARVSTRAKAGHLGPSARPAALIFWRNRRTFMTLPQIAMSHQRRERLRLRSTNNQWHSWLAHSRTRESSSLSMRSKVDHATGHSTRSSAAGGPLQSSRAPLSSTLSCAAESSGLSAALSASSAAPCGATPRATADNTS
jgi:hypothetical protein